MLPCPIPNCGHNNEIDATVCAKCGEDLTSFAKLYFLPAYYYNQGLKAAQNGQLDEAIKNLQVSVSLDPSEIDTLVVLGKVSAINGNYERAIEYWQQALEINPNNSEANLCIEKAAKILDEIPQISEKTTEPFELSYGNMLREITTQIKEIQKTQDGQNKQLKEIGVQIQAKEDESNRIISSLNIFQDLHDQQNQRLTKMKKWLKAGSSIAIAACVLIVLSAIFLWTNLEEQSKLITNMREEQASTSISLRTNLQEQSQLIGNIQKEQVATTIFLQSLPEQFDIIATKSEQLSKETTKNYQTIQQRLNNTSTSVDVLNKQLLSLQNQVQKLSITLSDIQKQISEIKTYEQTPSMEEKEN